MLVFALQSINNYKHLVVLLLCDINTGTRLVVVTNTA